MDTGEDLWDSLPEGEQNSVWDETERKFWVNFRSKKDPENKKIEKDFQLSINEVRLKLSDLTGQRSQLEEAQSRLARELAKVEAELARTTDECEEKASRLERIEQDYRASRQKRTETLHDIWFKMRRFFRQKRGEDPDAPDHLGPESEGIVLPEMLPEVSPGFNKTTPRVGPTNVTAVVADRLEEGEEDDEDRMEGVEHQDSRGVESLVDIVDADGNVIGPVEQIEPWNQWVEGIQGLEIRRPVKIRRGRRFNTTDLAGIYERTEAKGVKWLSCMIQATGAIQAKRCLSCHKNQGAFDDCIIVGGDLFQKCGNCEWNRQGCHGSSGDTIDLLALRERVQRKKQLEDGAQETSADRSSETVHQTVEVQPRSEQTSQSEPQRVDEQISVPYRPPSPKPAPQYPELTSERQADRQIETQPERQYEQQPEKQPERTIEPQPAPQTEAQAAWTTAPQPERRPEHQLEKVPDRPNERFHDVIAARATERTVEVVPIQIAERLREMSHRPAYGPPPGPLSRPTTAFRSGYAPERMIDPMDSPLPTPICPQTRLLETSHSVLPSSVLRHPHEVFHPSTGLKRPAGDYRGSTPAQTSPELEQIHTPQEPRVAAGFRPANVSRLPSSDRRRPTPPSLSLNPSLQPFTVPPSQPPEEINRGNMVLKNDGNVYTYPECVEGVPMVKINEEHPYWEDSWPNIKTLIKSHLTRRREELEAATEADPEKGQKRIVDLENRGRKILEFHEKGPISPHQLLGKGYIKDGLTSFDALFRLSETILELEKFNLDISPVDWLRQRLHELIQTQGINFSLRQTLECFYHDSELTSLRWKNGLDNRGHRSTALSHGSPISIPKPLQKRKQTERHAARTTAPQQERRPEHQPKKVPDRPNELLQDVIVAKVPERIVQVVPIQIAERPHEISQTSAYGPSSGPPTRSATAPRSNYAPERLIDHADSPLPTPNSVLPSGVLRRSPHEILHPSTELDGPARDYRGSDSAHIPREPEQIHTLQEYRIAAGFTPANVRRWLPSSNQGRPTPSSLSLDPSSQPPESPPAQPPEEITRENMVLKNNGNVYTYPECVAGVPLVKINEEHPYWEASWPNVKTLIEPQLAEWRRKSRNLIKAHGGRKILDAKKQRIDRQIYRGIKILEFHENGPISPYQLLGKGYIQAGKGGITSYDTLFRLSETISQLEKFNLDISPVDWMRQRLHELIQTQGHNFNLPRTIYGFYHDSKLTSLRSKHGLQRIGRPRGALKAHLSHGNPSNTPKPLQKRKPMHSIPTTPREDSFIDHSPLPSQAPPSYPAPVPAPAPVPTPGPQPAFSTHLNKKLKHMPSTHGSPALDEFYFEAWSDTDSCSGGSITKYDWRLGVVKTRLYTSNINVTQYWTWVGQIQCFQHQILKDVKPAKWGLYRDKIDFHVNVAEIEEMEWSIEGLCVRIIMKKDAGELAADGRPRGDVMASFPRERTLRRFLFFCRERSIKMAKRAPEQLNYMWESMVSKQLSDQGDSHQQLVE